MRALSNYAEHRPRVEEFITASRTRTWQNLCMEDATPFRAGYVQQLRNRVQIGAVPDLQPGQVTKDKESPVENHEN